MPTQQFKSRITFCIEISLTPRAVGSCSLQVGAVLRVAVPADDKTARTNLCITAKLGLDDSAPNKVEAACRSILTQTGLDYLDFFVMQNVHSIKVRMNLLF